jgi:hypothetical protein
VRQTDPGAEAGIEDQLASGAIEGLAGVRDRHPAIVGAGVGAGLLRHGVLPLVWQWHRAASIAWTEWSAIR